NGVPQWQEEVGCLSTPPGDFSDGVSVRQTQDGGYIIGGGTIGCGSGSTCPSTSGVSCALVEKVDATGRLSWSRAYLAGANGRTINAIQQTGDGGYVAVGSTTDATNNTIPLVIKLDGNGN